MSGSVPRIKYQLMMGSGSEHPARTGSVVELYGLLFDAARTFIPPHQVLNDKLRQGIDWDRGHEAHVLWDSLQLDASEYQAFRVGLLLQTDSSGAPLYDEVACPASIDTWARFCEFIRNHTLSRVAQEGCERADAMVRREAALKRDYRLALAHGDDATAAEVRVEIRRLFDPDFS
jgi:hypothetical protein